MFGQVASEQTVGVLIAAALVRAVGIGKVSLHAKFVELDSREAELKAKESRLTELEKMAEEAPTKLEEAVKQAKDSLGKKLQTAHAAEAKDARLQAEHQRSIHSC